MIDVSPFSERLRKAFEPTRRGVVGLVEDLLDLCREQDLELEWHSDRCRVVPLGDRSQEATEIPLPKSVFRAMLARIAALCNEQKPDSVAPHVGEGEISVGGDPPTIFHVVFNNTPGDQRLEVRQVDDHASGTEEAARGQERLLGFQERFTTPLT